MVGEHRREEFGMSSDDADTEQDQSPTEEDSEQGRQFGRDAEDERERADEADDVVETPEGEFPADAKGFDGSPVEEIVKDREERLAEENRPENAEVSNAGREFDGEKGMFKDEDGFEEAEKKYSLDDT